MSWLGGSAALAVLSFDVDAESPILARGRRYADHAMVMTHQAYGPQVGVPRLLELLDDFGIKATFFVPGLTADRYPQTVERILAAGHEVGHHSYSHRSPVDLGEAGEREDFERALASLHRLGVTPKGHRSALWEASWDTPSLVAEYGLEYDSTLMDDDKPYLLETPKGTIAELPPHWSLDDWEQYAYLPRPEIGTNIESPAKVLDLWTNELDAMRRHGCLFMLTNHPFLSGRPGRVETLRKLVEHALSRGDVEFVTAAEVAARVRVAEAALARVDELAGEEWVREDTAQRVRAQLDYRRRRFVAAADGDGNEEFEDRTSRYIRLMYEVYDAQREELIALRNAGDISDEVRRRVERELDLEESRLS